MVRDLMLNIAEGDLRTEDKAVVTEPVFDVAWGSLFDEDIDEDVLMCNVIIPVAYESLIGYRDGELEVRFSAGYVPNYRRVLLRLVVLDNQGNYCPSEITGYEGLEVSAYTPDSSEPTVIPAAQLIYLNSDGRYAARFRQASEDSPLASQVCVFSGSHTDLAVSFSDNQAAKLLSLCAPGKHYRYPSCGVGITGFLNSVIDHTNFEEILKTQFEADGKPIRSAAFDSSNCDLDVFFSPEKEKSDVGLADISELDWGFFNDFKDTLPVTITHNPTYIEHGTGEYPEPSLPIGVPEMNLPIYQYVDYERWVLGQEYHFRSQNNRTGIWEISRVTHDGARWQCLRDTSWIEPQYPSQNWEMLSGFLRNPDFENNLYGWNFDTEIEIFTINNKWIWANNNILSYPIRGIWMSNDGNRRVVTIYKSFLQQREEDFRGYPRIRQKDGVRKALDVYLTFLYRVIEPGRISIRFDNTSDEGFEPYQPMNHEADLEAGEQFQQLTVAGKWNGTGDFTIEFTGKLNLCDFHLSIEGPENII